MLRIIIASLCSKNKKYAAASKIEGTSYGFSQDGALYYPYWRLLMVLKRSNLIEYQI
jgi:hypothetical protein